MNGPVGDAMPVPRREMTVTRIRRVETVMSVSVPVVSVPMTGPVDEAHRGHHDQPEKTRSEEHRINQQDHPLLTVPSAFGTQLSNGNSSTSGTRVVILPTDLPPGHCHWSLVIGHSGRFAPSANLLLCPPGVAVREWGSGGRV